MRRRNMFNLTGLPGWMRFGYSPGWVGRDPSGLGPCARFLMTGAWPFAQPNSAAGQQGAFGALADNQSREEFLKTCAQNLEHQLGIIKQQLDMLSKEKNG